MNQPDKAGSRSIDVSIAIDAPVEPVWQAIAEPAQLANWFPLEAQGGQGQGAAVTLSWGPDMAWTTYVTVWEPGRRVQWGNPDDASDAQLVDFTVETDGARTVVRLVHSGFGAGADWDDQFDGTLAGWTYFLLNLKHYVEQHRGTRRAMVWTRQKLSGARAAAWTRMFGDDGLVLCPLAQARAGADVAVDLGGQVPYSGRFEMVTDINGRANNVAVRLPTLGDALLFVELEPGAADPSCGIWLSTYGLDAAQVARMQADLTDRVARVVSGCH